MRIITVLKQVYKFSIHWNLLTPSFEYASSSFSKLTSLTKLLSQLAMIYRGSFNLTPHFALIHTAITYLILKLILRASLSEFMNYIRQIVSDCPRRFSPQVLYTCWFVYEGRSSQYANFIRVANQQPSFCNPLKFL